MLSALEQRQLKLLQKRQGSRLTSAEALDLALQAEQFKNDCGPGDPAWPKFSQDQRDLEQMALLLEKQEQASVVTEHN